MENPYHSEEELILEESFQNWVNNTNAQDCAYWENWIGLHPEKREMVEHARRIVLSLFPPEQPLPEPEVAQAWLLLNTTLENRSQQHTPPFVRLRWGSLHRWAAVFAGLLIVSASYWWLSHHQSSFTTPYGETALLTLPDGSVVKLNGNSTLSYSPDWDKNHNREVWLKGEAFFSVTKKPGQGNAKFIVHTNDLKVEVLGTTFNVANRKSKTQVVLNTGKVKLTIKAAKALPPVLMAPGESVEFLKKDEKVTKRRVNPEDYSSWQDHKLVFHDTPLSEVAELIEATYGIQIQFENKTQMERRLTGSIQTPSVDKLLLALSKTFGLEISRQNNRIIIHSTPSATDESLDSL